MTKHSAPVNKKQFDRDKSPFHLLFIMDNKFVTREFPSMEELAKFVKQLSLTWNDYGIIHGEMVKEVPERDLDEDIPDEEVDQPQSGIEDLAPDDAEHYQVGEDN